MLKIIPAEYHDKAKGTLKLLWEEEWRGMGITQVRGVGQEILTCSKANPSAEPGLGTL
jgi:cyclin-dependent kinase regulatory subunit CKS1